MEPAPDHDTRTGSVARPGGRSLSWRSTGPVGAPVLLWMHGSTGSARTAPRATGVRVLAYDRPGFGGSTVHPDRDLRSDADDVGALLDQVGVAEARVLAFSGGAAPAYAFAARFPERLRCLAVVSGVTWPAGPVPPLDVLRQAATTLRADPVAAVDRLGHDAPPRDRLVLADPHLRQELVRGARDALAEGVRGWVHEALLVRGPWPLVPSDVQVPVTLWHGDQDLAVPIAAAETTAEALPDARLVRLADAGHLGWLTQRSAIVRSVLAG